MQPSSQGVGRRVGRILDATTQLHSRRATAKQPTMVFPGSFVPTARRRRSRTCRGPIVRPWTMKSPVWTRSPTPSEQTEVPSLTSAAALTWKWQHGPAPQESRRIWAARRGRRARWVKARPQAPALTLEEPAQVARVLHDSPRRRRQRRRPSEPTSAATAAYDDAVRPKPEV